MKRKPKFIIVNKMPEGAGEDTIGWHVPNTNRIYIRKDHDSEYLRNHEFYHFLKNHSDKPRNPDELIDHEIEAELYATENSRTHRQPKRMIMAMLNQHRETYYKPAKSTYKRIGKRLKKYKVGKEWQDGYRKAGVIVNNFVKKNGERA